MSSSRFRFARRVAVWFALLVFTVAPLGAGLRSVQAQTAPIFPDPNHAWSIMPLGDSLTEGQSGASQHWSYRGYLQKRLFDNGYHYDFQGGNTLGQTFSFPGLDNDHEGRGGYSIGGVENRLRDTIFYGQFQSNVRMGLTDNITSYLQAASPEIVLLMAGINDVQMPIGGPLLGPDPETVRYPRLVSMIQSLRPGVKIVVATLLPVKPGVTTFDTNRINQLNTVIRQLARASYSDNIYLADMAVLNMTIADYADDLHLSQSGASKAADVWYDALTNAQFPPSATPTATATRTNTPQPSATRTATPTHTPTPVTPTATTTVQTGADVALTVQVQTSGFVGLAGWTVRVTNNASGDQAQVLTDVDGLGRFDLPAGPYQICELVQPGWTNTYPAGGCFYQSLSAGSYTLQFLNQGGQLTPTTPPTKTSAPPATTIVPTAGATNTRTPTPIVSPPLRARQWLPLARR